MVMLIVLIMMILIIMIIIMMMNTEKLEALEDYLGFDGDYYKPIRTNDTFDGERNIITQNIRVEEKDMKIYHPKNILK